MTTMPTPLISVLMPVFNAERYLREAIDSVLAQSVQDLEFVVVDDGSADGSAAIIAEAARRDARVRPLYRTHRGFADTLNSGLAAARGQWVARMDADDVCVPDRLEAQLAFADRYPGIAVVGSYAWYLSEDGRMLGLYRLGPTTPAEFDRAVERGQLVHMCHPTVMMDRRAVLEAGGYDERFPIVEDCELFNRLVDRGHVLLTLPEPKLLYRVHANSIVMSRHRQMYRMFRYVSEVVGARRQRLEPPTYEEFVDAERRQSWARRAWVARGDLGAYFYRRAGLEFGRRRLLSSAGFVSLSALLAPNRVIARLPGQLLGRFSTSYAAVRSARASGSRSGAAH
jgi:glycosyltransferase involved in cell wall biosynthesis